MGRRQGENSDGHRYVASYKHGKRTIRQRGRRKKETEGERGRENKPLLHSKSRSMALPPATIYGAPVTI